MPSPIGHFLMGASLYADRPAEGRRSALELAAFVFFANAPDLDFIPGILTGHAHAFHRGGTHSLVFAVVAALAVALVFSWRGRAAAVRWGRMAFFGILSHVVLDYFCAPSASLGVSLFWPLSAERFASEPSIFPLLSSETIVSWGNVVAVIGEAALVGLILMIALVRRALLERAHAPVSAPAPRRDRAYGFTEVSE